MRHLKSTPSKRSVKKNTKRFNKAISTGKMIGSYIKSKHKRKR